LACDAKEFLYHQSATADLLAEANLVELTVHRVGAATFNFSQLSLANELEGELP